MDKSKTIHAALVSIQQELKAPKGQQNKFGNYAYRSCEDILEAVKPLLHTYGAALVIGDAIVQFGEHLFVQAEAVLSNGTEHISNKAYAMHPLTKKGMDASQITGAASSYARKYALNGLFCIDDTKDADSTNRHGKDAPKAKKQPAPQTATRTDEQKLADGRRYLGVQIPKLGQGGIEALYIEAEFNPSLKIDDMTIEQVTTLATLVAKEIGAKK